MKQKEYLGFGSLKYLEGILKNNHFENIFLVTGKESYESCGAKEVVSQLMPAYSFSRFCDFRENPRLEDVESGMRFFSEKNYDLILAIGGGSVMDMAKLINIFSPQSGKPIEYVKKVRRNVSPNKAELELLTFLSKDWEFTGDWKHVIDGKVPDFTNYKTKQLIELYGDYYHQGQNPQERTWFFERQGWKCRIVWESELKNHNKLKSKLDRFCKGIVE